MTTKEEVRRQASCIEARKQQEGLFTIDEIEDLWSVLDTAIKIQDFKIQTMILEIFLHPEFISNTRLIKSFSPEAIEELIEKEQVKSLYKIQQLALDVRTRYEEVKRIDEAQGENELDESQENPKSVAASSAHESSFEKPMSLRV